MKLREILMELYAPVYVNSKKTLYLINNLIEKEFGLDTYEGSGGMCLLSQVVFSIAAASGIPSQTIANYFSKRTDGRVGHSLEDLLEFFQSIEIFHAGRLHKLKLSFKKYKNIERVIADLKKGQPVTFITSADHPLYDQLENVKDDDYQPRIVDKGLLLGFSKDVTKNAEDWDRQVYHALLFVGYDVKFKQLIGRESRDSYGYKGYFKVLANELKDHFNQFAFLSVVVDDVVSKEAPEGFVDLPKFKKSLNKAHAGLPEFIGSELEIKFKDETINGKHAMFVVLKNEYLIAVYQDQKMWFNEDFAKMIHRESEAKFDLKSSFELSTELKTAAAEDSLKLDFPDDQFNLKKTLEELRTKAEKLSIKQLCELKPAKDVISDFEYDFDAYEKFDVENESHVMWFLTKMIRRQEIFNYSYIQNTKYNNFIFVTVKTQTSRHGSSMDEEQIKKLMNDHDLFFANLKTIRGKREFKKLWLITEE